MASEKYTSAGSKYHSFIVFFWFNFKYLYLKICKSSTHATKQPVKVNLCGIKIYLLQSLFECNFLRRRRSFTDKFVADADTVVDAVVGDYKAVDEGKN